MTPPRFVIGRKTPPGSRAAHRNPARAQSHVGLDYAGGTLPTFTLVTHAPPPPITRARPGEKRQAPPPPRRARPRQHSFLRCHRRRRLERPEAPVPVAGLEHVVLARQPKRLDTATHGAAIYPARDRSVPETGSPARNRS